MTPSATCKLQCSYSCASNANVESVEDRQQKCLYKKLLLKTGKP
ncbi:MULTISPECIES: hypothetical protein [unclassified Wolbachia]|nr:MULTISPECIES: hypothetical protein [unclassified Wolbachia]